MRTTANIVYTICFMKQIYKLFCIGKKSFVSVLITALSTLPVRATGTIHVIDAEDSGPLMGVSVFSASGVILGATDTDGAFSSARESDYPLTLKCMGYMPAICKRTEGRVALVPATMELGEVTVTPADRPVARLVCYVREYTSAATATDTIRFFAEHVGDFYYTTTKVKKFKAPDTFRPLVAKLYERITDNHGLDSVSSPEFNKNDFVWLDMLELPHRGLTESENGNGRSAGTAYTDTIRGKYGLKSVARKTDKAYTLISDCLADKKGHKMSPFLFKLLGMTLDITELQETWSFKANENGIYNPSDILYGSLTMAVTGKGKWIRKAFNSATPIEMRGYFEIYPLRVEYLTPEEAREQVKGNPPAEKFERSPLATPLPPATQELVDRVSALKNNHH